MKHIIAIFLLFISCLSSNADTVIQMENYGGVYRIPCFVNGAKMKFIFDTGASNVCLSMTMAEYLYDNGYIEAKDIKGTGSSSVADGRIVDHIVLILKDVQIGDLHLYNVEAVVVDGQNAPLLMGQSALKKLGSYEINGSMLIIHNDGEDNLDDQIENLRNLASEASRYNMYNKAADYYAQLYSMDELWGQELMSYAHCLQKMKEYDTALEVLFSITDYDWYIDNDVDFYWYIANVYFDAGDYHSAIEYYRLSNKYFSNSPLTSVARNLYDIAFCYNLCDLFGFAKKAYWESFVAYCEKANANANIIWEECWKLIPKNGKSLRKDIPMLDDIVFNYVMNQYFNKEFSHYELNNKLKTLSDCGNKRAREQLSY